MIPDPLFLGVDLGTSALKCALFDGSGNCAGAARVPYPTYDCGGDGGAEQDCLDWWRAFSTGVRRATIEVDRARIAAIGVGGHAPSPAFVDSHLEPVCPVLPWFDGRSAALRDQLLQNLGRCPANGGERLMVQIAARAMWLCRTTPRAFARANRVLNSGDYLVTRLTGECVMTSPRVPDVFAAANLPLELIPEKECRSGEPVGRISTPIAGELGLPAGVPVVTGGLDSFLASVGSGMRQPGDSCLNTGSSAVVALLARSGCAGRFEWAGCPLLSRPTRPGGRIMQWAQRFASPDHSFNDLLLQAATLRPPSPIQRNLPAFIRAAEGEDREAHRALSEIAQHHTPVELFRLLLDAIFLSQRAVLAELERHEPVRCVRSVGGLAAYPDVNQLQADVLGRTVQVPRTTESGALGAAMLAAIVVEDRTPQECASGMVKPNRITHPRDDVATIYGRLMGEIQESNHAGR